MSIFAVHNADLDRLSPEQAVELVRDLLWAEARRIGLAATKVTVSTRVDVADGGIDATVNERHVKGSFMRPALSGYQIKAGRIDPWRDAEIRKVLFGIKGVSKKENLGASVRECLDKKGTYVLVCTKVDLTPQQRHKSVDLLIKNLKACGYRDPKVEVWGQNQLIGVLETFPSLRLQTNGRSHLKFQTHKSWSQQEDMQKAFKAGPEQQRKIHDLQAAVRSSQGAAIHIRVLGEAGIGKTRLVLEATAAEDLRPLVVYSRNAVDFGHSDLLNELLKDDNQFAAVIVVDECDRGASAEIWNRIRNLGARIKLISIHNEVERLTAGDTQYVDAPALQKGQIAEILKEYGVPDDQTDRWAELCGGSPRMAHMVGGNLKSNPNDLLREPDTATVYDRSIVGRDAADSPKVRQRRVVLRHLALFKRFGYRGGRVEAEARAIAAIIREADPSITWAGFQEIIEELRNRKILQGESTLYITPKLLHIRLWVDYWETYGNGFESEAFLGRLSEKLTQWFFEMFAYATESRTATEIVEAFLAPDGLFERSGFLDHPLGARFFRALSEAHPRAALASLKRSVGALDKQRLIEFRDGRRYVVWALQGIAMWRDLFPDAARLLLQLAEAENETWSNSATGVFADLFSPGPGRVAPTEASPEERFPILVEALRSESKERRLLALQAADQALESDHFSRMSGAEYQGLRVVPDLWVPKTYGELWEAYRRVWKLLDQSLEQLPHDEQKRGVSILLQRARALSRYQDLFGTVIESLSRLATKPYVDTKELIETIERVLHYDGKRLPVENRRQWKELRDSLVGSDFQALMRRYVGMDILEDKVDDEGNIVENKTESKLRDLAMTSVQQPDLLASELEWLVTSAARNGYRFAYALGKTDSGYSLLPRLLDAQRMSGENGSAFFLGGYFKAIREADNARWEDVLDELAADERLHRHVPEISWRSGFLSDRAAMRVMGLVRTGVVPVSALHVFAFGSAVSQLSADVVDEWIRFLLSVGDLEAASIALELLQFYYDRRQNRQLPKELAASVLMAPALFQPGDSRSRHDRINWEWSEVARRFVRDYPEASLSLADVMVEHFGEEGTIVGGFHSQAQRILDEIMRQKPRETWRAIAKYLGPPIDARAYHLTTWLRGEMFEEREGQGVLAVVPLDELWSWVDEDIEKRGWYLASFVPKVLSRTGGQVCLAREVLIRYGDRKEVRNNLIANFSTEGWSGPESAHYDRKKSKLLEFRKGEDSAMVKRWIDEYVEMLDRQIVRSKIEEEREEF